MELVQPECVLSSRRLILQPILPLHALALFADIQAPELYRFIPDNPPETKEVLEDKYTRWVRRRSVDGTEIWLNYAVYCPRYSNYIGTVQATLHDFGKTYIAYEVFPRYWRQGFAQEACMALITHLFTGYKVSTVSALVDTRNKPSWKLLESLNFQRIGIIENADEFKGAVSNEYIYELHSG